MTDRTNDFVFVGFWKRVLAVLIDLAIGFPLLPITRPIRLWSVQNRNILPYILWWLALEAILLWLVVCFGGTPGKLAIRVRIVDGSGKFLSWGRAVLRIVVPKLISCPVYFLQMGTAVSRYPESAPHTTSREISRLIVEYGQPYSTLLIAFALIGLVDIVVILFNKRKRAIHDFIAGSYVITRKSYLALSGGANDEESLESSETA